MALRLGTLDVRTLPHGQKHAEAFRRFDALEPGQAWVLVSDHEPRGLLAEFQAKRPRAFEWNVLERGPEVYRIELERRAAPAERTVSEYLGRDHARLDALMADARECARRGDAAGARASFLEFTDGLIRHIQGEELTLFPAFEKATGITSGPTAVMRSEHREIGRLLEDGRSALEAGDASRFVPVAASLVHLLAAHNGKEENVLYPMMDRTLPGAGERDALVAELQAQSSEGGCGCCSGEKTAAARGGRKLGVVS